MVSTCSTSGGTNDDSSIEESQPLELQEENDSVSIPKVDETNANPEVSNSTSNTVNTSASSEDPNLKEDSVRQYLLDRMLEEKTLNQGLPRDTTKNP